MKLQIIKKKTGWYWRILAKNGKVLCHSETYRSLRDARHAALLVGGKMPGVEVEYIEAV